MGNICLLSVWEVITPHQTLNGRLHFHQITSSRTALLGKAATTADRRANLGSRIAGLTLIKSCIQIQRGQNGRRGQTQDPRSPKLTSPPTSSLSRPRLRLPVIILSNMRQSMAMSWLRGPPDLVSRLVR